MGERGPKLGSRRQVIHRSPLKEPWETRHVIEDFSNPITDQTREFILDILSPDNLFDYIKDKLKTDAEQAVQLLATDDVVKILVMNNNGDELWSIIEDLENPQHQMQILRARMAFEILEGVGRKPCYQFYLTDRKKAAKAVSSIRDKAIMNGEPVYALDFRETPREKRMLLYSGSQSKPWQPSFWVQPSRGHAKYSRGPRRFRCNYRPLTYQTFFCATGR